MEGWKTKAYLLPLEVGIVRSFWCSPLSYERLGSLRWTIVSSCPSFQSFVNMLCCLTSVNASWFFQYSLAIECSNRNWTWSHSGWTPTTRRTVGCWTSQHWGGEYCAWAWTFENSGAGAPTGLWIGLQSWIWGIWSFFYSWLRWFIAARKISNPARISRVHVDDDRPS